MNDAIRYRNGSIIGRVAEIRRAGTSANGNPSWFVTIRTDDDGEHTFRTMDDVMLSYAIGNAEYRDHSHRYGLTRSGRLNGYADRVEGS